MVHVGKTIQNNLHLNAKEEIFSLASELRKTMTEAEQRLWQELKNRKLNGLKFRRQHPIHYYIADFYCHEKRLIVELDGGVHDEVSVKEHDDNRSAELDRRGIRVLRFTNEKVIQSIDTVCQEIIQYTETHPQ